MKLYAVKINNSIEYFSDGSIRREFFVFADNLVDATMQADETLSVMRKELESFALTDCADGLCIVSMSEHADIVGNIGVQSDSLLSSKAWSAAEFAENVRKSVQKNTSK